MPIVRMPDGTQVRFPDDMPGEQIKSLILSKFPDAGQGQTTPAPAIAQTPQIYNGTDPRNDYLNLPIPGTAPPEQPQAPARGGTGPVGNALQFLSGVNEGAADLLSLPNTVEMGLRSIGPAAVNAMGGNVQMPTESLLPDIGARYRELSNSFGAIKPESSDPTDQFLRRVGKDVGSTVIPAMGAPSAVLPMLSAVGSGIGAATANAVAPGNKTAELLAQMIGGGTVLGAANAFERNALSKTAPSIDELRAQASGLYDAAKNSGVRFPQQTVKSAVDDITSNVLSEGLDETLHPGAVAALKRLQQAAGTGMTAQDAQTLRRIIGAAAGNPTNPDQARIAGIMKEMFDKRVTSAIPELAPANALFAQAKKGQLIEDAFTRARDRLGVNYNNAGMVTALRQELNRILQSPKLSRGLTEAETAAIRDFVRGGKVENAMRWLGRFAPTGAFPIASTVGGGAGLGLLAGNPTAGAVATGGLSAAGLLARKAGNAMAMNSVDKISAMLRGGGAPIPFIAPKTVGAAVALGVGQAANQNDPTTQRIIQMILRPQALN